MTDRRACRERAWERGRLALAECWKPSLPARRALLCAAVVLATAAVALGILALSTQAAMGPAPQSLDYIAGDASRLEIVDRNGVPLNVTYANEWNLHTRAPLHEIPEFLVTAFLYAEDARFLDHSGQDWRARLAALGQNLRAGRAVRGASTITEQVIRMIRPRPRTLWSRWVEGWEASRLEGGYPKQQILEFYLNQVPYAANRRGVVQAARYYFDRDLSALNYQEMLALAVLVRAPSRLDLRRGDRAALERAIGQLAARMEDGGILPGDRAPFGEFDLRSPVVPVQAEHFLRFANERFVAGPGNQVRSRLQVTLDGSLQTRLQGLLNRRLETLAGNDVNNAALLAANHKSGEILAWVVGAAGEDTPARLVDAVRSPRQPGSSLKPFLYALALERGWTAASLIEDAPLIDMVGVGLHSYRNYSGMFHGPITLRQALGNSLNTPAVRTITFTGEGRFLDYLQRLGFSTLIGKTDHYGPGLALGNGEVSLLELTQAYAAIANRGLYREFSLTSEDEAQWTSRRAMSPEIASLLSDILSDPQARRLEFNGGLLDFPLQTAVKTGTSNDYRDSWAVGFDDQFVIGVWMGNLDRRPTVGVTGAIGPAMVLRAAFDLLSRSRNTAPLWLSPRLQRHEICADSGIAWRPGMPCPRRAEYFVPGTGPLLAPSSANGRQAIVLSQPTEGLLLAYDPRVPPEFQAFDFVLTGVSEQDRVDWRINGGPPQAGEGPRFPWPIQRGQHRVSAEVWREGEVVAQLEETSFTVR